MPHIKIISLANDGFYSCNDLLRGDALDLCETFPKCFSCELPSVVGQ